jgi:hypothetical protein
MRPGGGMGMLKSMPTRGSSGGGHQWRKGVAENKSLFSTGSSAASWLGRSLLAGAGYSACTSLGGAAAQALRLSAPSFGSAADPVALMAAMFASGVMIGLVIGPFASRLPPAWIERAGVLFAVLYVLNSLSNAIEGLFFMTLPVSEWGFSLFLSAVQLAGTAALLASLFPPQSERRGLPEILREYFGRRPWYGWLMRLLVAGAAYLLVYFFFGMIAFPFVARYYQDPSFGLQLTVPGLEVILPLEIGREMLYTLTLLPLVAVLQTEKGRSRAQILFWIFLVQAVLSAWQPMLNASFWPADMRLAHGLEITADCAVFGMIFVLLFVPARARTDGVRTYDPVSS